MSNMLGHADHRMVVFTASFVCYLIYKQFEPNTLSVHFPLLFGVPAFLVYQSSSQLSLLQQIGTVLSYWGLILAFTVIYRLSPFHPLAEYPGPTLAKLSKIYWAYLNARGDPYRVAKHWHDKCGDVVRIGPNELSFRRFDAVQPIYGSKTMQKGPYYDSRATPQNIIQLDGVRDFSVHGARRKPWIKAMSTSALKGYEPFIHLKTGELLEELSRRQGETINISQWMTLYGFDFMGHMAFGREFGMLKTGNDHLGLIHTIEEGVYGAAIISHIPWILPFLQHIPQTTKGLRHLQRITASYAAERTKAGSTTKDLFYFLTEDDVGVQSGATPEEIVADGMLAIIAGSDTTAIALSHLWYFLLRHPECAEQLRKEIDAVFPPGEDVMDFSRHAEMPYLNACINETLRLLPPALSGLQRTVARGSGGAMIGPYFVPENTQVSVHIFALHRDPREFSPLPETFWPDRWLNQDSYVLPTGDVVRKEQVITNRAAHIPFSVGPQNCAGRALAVVEMRAVACAMLRRFKLGKPKDYDLDQWEKDIVDVYVTIIGKLPVVLEPRQV